MAEAVIEAREKDIDVLVGGGDSNSSALDKFFADGTMDMLEKHSLARKKSNVFVHNIKTE